MVGVDVSCSGFMEARSRRSLGFVLRVTWAGVICARVVWPRFLEAVSTSAKRNFLALAYAVLSEVPSQCVVDRMPACHEVDGRPSPHKSPSGSSEKCPSTHEV